MAKLLICIDWYTPGYKAGGPIQSVQNLVEVLKDQFEIFILTGDRDAGEPEPYALPTATWIQQGAAKVMYLSPDQRSQGQIRQLIKQIQPEVIYLNSMFSFPFTVYPIRGRGNAQVILAPRGMLHAGALRIKKAKKRVFLRAFKLAGLHRSIQWHATDDQEVLDIQAHFGDQASITQAGNIPKRVQKPWSVTPKESGDLRLFFNSRVSEKKNLLFAIQSLQSVQGRVQFDVFGPHEDAEYLALCQSAAKELPSGIIVSFHGPKPPMKLMEGIETAHFGYLPTHGENFGHSIFESFLAGKPVLISDQTPWRNLETQQLGWDLPLDDPNAFTQTLQTLVDMDATTYQIWSRNAWRFAKAYNEDPALISQTNAIFA
ncbi:glycosyltransferase [Pontibacter sp. G13]|uniref:glycosyltransferase n=1 Tax=Pontibacter sp. G13 TaxID=3074898 RepID=UPI00288B5229|nr:glycosyltransferase [Pontibacter sp. G13]WNJ19273.1 glycosyltransferase [Pontibacter sp. G13]